MFEQITEFLLDLLDQIGYLGVFLASVLESFLAPLPSEIVLVTAGLNAKEQESLFVLAAFVGVASLGNFVGTLPFYLISYFSRDNLLPKLLDRWGKWLLISHDDLEKADRLFAKRGKPIVFFSKLIPGIRSIIAFPAGVAKMNFFQYMIYSLLGSSLWNTVLISIGYVAYDYKDEVFAWIKPFEKGILGVLILLTLVYLYKVIRNSFVDQED